MSDVSRLPLTTKEPFGTATTAAPPEQSAIGHLTDRHIAALTGRGLDVELLVKLGVGASDRLGSDGIAIPYFDGDVRIGCKHRTFAGDKRFTQDVGSRQVFYNADCLRDETLTDEPLIITEGEVDCWSALQAGFSRTVSVPNGAPKEAIGAADSGTKYSFLTEAMPLLRECRRIIIATDNDGPGHNLRSDLALRLGAHRCWFVDYPRDCKDLNDALRIYGERGVIATINRAQPLKIEGYYEIDQLPELVDPQAYDTGIVNLGDHYKLRLGDLTVVTGVPGHGKSSFINEVCCRMAQKHGWKTIFASFEQAPQTDHRRALRTFYAEKLERFMNDDEKRAADAWIKQHFGFIVPSDSDDVTLQWLLDVATAAALRKEAQIVVIDPWNEMDHVRERDQSQTDYVGAAIREARRWARKMRVHLIIAAHPAKMQRGKDGKHPIVSLYDIAESAHWANKPEVGIVVHRPDVAKNEAIIKIAKVRFDSIGRPGEITGIWDRERTRYTIADQAELL